MLFLFVINRKKLHTYNIYISWNDCACFVKSLSCIYCQQSPDFHASRKSISFLIICIIFGLFSFSSMCGNFVFTNFYSRNRIYIRWHYFTYILKIQIHFIIHSTTPITIERSSKSNLIWNSIFFWLLTFSS